MQKKFRKVKFGAVLPDEVHDFSIKPLKYAEEIFELGIEGPFVIIAVVRKNTV